MTRDHLVVSHGHRSDRKETAHEVCQDHRQPGADGRRAGIRGLRIPVATVVGMVADGMSTAEILDAYPDLDCNDIQEALLFAAEAVRERALPLANPE